MERNDNLLLPFTIISYFFCVAIHFWLVYTTVPFNTTYEYLIIFFSLFLSLGICLISAPNKWLSELMLEVKEKTDISKRKIIAILLCSVIVILKLAAVVYYAINEKGFKEYYLFLFVIHQLILDVSAVLLEELLFKCGIYRLLMRTKLNKIILYFIVGILFSIIHIEKDFSLVVVLSAFVFQFISLCIFDLYPSFSVVYWFHFMVNFVAFM